MNKHAQGRKSALPWFIGALVVLLFLAWLWLSWWPRGFIAPSRAERRLSAIPNILRMLEGAKEQYALEHHATNGTPVTPADLAPHLKDGKRILESALDRWYQKHGQTGLPPTSDELATYLTIEEFVKPVAGEIYTIKPVGELNTVTVPQTPKTRFNAGGVFTATSF